MRPVSDSEEFKKDFSGSESWEGRLPSNKSARHWAILITAAGNPTALATWIPKLLSQTPAFTLNSNTHSPVISSSRTVTWRFEIEQGFSELKAVSSWKWVAKKVKQPTRQARNCAMARDNEIPSHVLVPLPNSSITTKELLVAV